MVRPSLLEGILDLIAHVLHIGDVRLCSGRTLTSEETVAASPHDDWRRHFFMQNLQKVGIDMSSLIGFELDRHFRGSLTPQAPAAHLQVRKVSGTRQQ